MKRNTLVIGAVMLGLLAVNPPKADAHGLQLPRKIQICHLEDEFKGTLELPLIGALLHLLFHRFDQLGACDVLPS